MLRNKGAHLGDDVFRYFGLFGPNDSLYLFVPRVWPYFFEEQMKPVGEDPKEPLPDYLFRTLIHQDYISFAEGLNAKVRQVVSATSGVLRAAYTMFSEFALNQNALVEIKSNSFAYSFEHFENAGAPVAG